MRSGSPAQDDGSWPSPQRPHSQGAMGNPVHFGSGARGEPQDVPGGPGTGRREAPFGPEISWPYGFRPLDPESRDVLESAYGTGPLNSGSVYQPQVMDDYGDPGYSDPSYEGPSHGGSAFPGGPAYPGRSGSPGFAGGPASSAPSSSGSSFGSGGFGTPRGSGGDGRRAADGGVPGYRLPDCARGPATRRRPAVTSGR